MLKQYQSLPFGVYILSFCQGLGITTAVISVSISGLIGRDLAPTPSLTTLPYGLQFAAILCTSLLISLLMERFGRRPIFLLGSIIGCASGLLGYYAIINQDFFLYCLAHVGIGIFMVNVALFRFAALDISPPEQHKQALPLVLFGGVFASLLGPFLSRNAAIFFGGDNFTASYLSVTVVCGIVFALLLTIQFPAMRKKDKAAEVESQKVSATKPLIARNFLGLNLFTGAVICGGIGYGLMNLLMITSSIEMKSLDIHFNHISYVIQVHVFFMFFPALFSSFIISKIGVYRYIYLGILLQVLSCVVAISGQTIVHFHLSLFLLALAWNCLYVGGSYLVGQLYTGELKFRAQGMNDQTVSIFSTISALSAGALITGLGWVTLNLIGLSVIIAVFITAHFFCFTNKNKTQQEQI